MPALRWDPVAGFDHVERTLAEALALGVGGFIIFGGTASAVANLTADLARRAGRPLLFAADLERGAGQQFEGLCQAPPPGALGALGDLAAIRRAARVTAAEARSVGIGLVLAPVADLDVEPANPIIQTRAFGADPGAVAAAVAAWVEGCRAGGCHPCLKHFPGHGRTTADSHAMLPVVEATGEQLAREDLAPFRAGVAAGAAAVMTAHVRYSSLDGERAATFSSKVIGLLREDLGFDGPVVTDALNMAGARPPAGVGAGADTGGERDRDRTTEWQGTGRGDGGRTGNPVEWDPAVAAVMAGVDLLLYPADLAAAAAALDRAVAAGAIPPARLAAALARRERVLVPPPAGGARPGASREDDHRWSQELADRVLAAPGGEPRGRTERLAPPARCTVIDDDLGGPFDPGTTDLIPRALEDSRRRSTREGALGGGIVLLFSSPRAWKGRAGLGEKSLRALGRAVSGPGKVGGGGGGAQLAVLFGHPRLAEQIPTGVPVLVAWHRHRLMQQAVLRWLEARTR